MDCLYIAAFELEILQSYRHHIASEVGGSLLLMMNRDNLVHVLLLVDASTPPQQLDIECANWLAECQVPFAFVFTKTDASKKEGPSCTK
jgi:GTP-binding protein EngB required for normal cell division